MKRKQVDQAAVHLRVARVGRYGTAATGDRLVVPTRAAERRAEIVVRWRKAGRDFGRALEGGDRRVQITRVEQDAFAASSQNKAEAAQKSGRFKDEIVPVTVKTRKGDVVVDTDEFPRHGTTVDTLAKLRPAFSKEGSVTAGNASGINDGAAVVVLMSAAQAAKENKKVIARIVSWAQAGVDPSIMGVGPIPASKKALEKVKEPLEKVAKIEGLEQHLDSMKVRFGAIESEKT